MSSSPLQDVDFFFLSRVDLATDVVCGGKLVLIVTLPGRLLLLFVENAVGEAVL